MQQSCNPRVRAAPLRILSPQVTALGSAQFPGYNSLGYTDYLQRVAFVGIEPGILRACCIHLNAPTIPLSAQIAEWYVLKDLCNGRAQRRRAAGSAGRAGAGAAAAETAQKGVARRRPDWVAALRSGEKIAGGPAGRRLWDASALTSAGSAL